MKCSNCSSSGVTHECTQCFQRMCGECAQKIGREYTPASKYFTTTIGIVFTTAPTEEYKYIVGVQHNDSFLTAMRLNKTGTVIPPKGQKSREGGRSFRVHDNSGVKNDIEFVIPPQGTIYVKIEKEMERPSQFMDWETKELRPNVMEYTEQATLSIDYNAPSNTDSIMLILTLDESNLEQSSISAIKYKPLVKKRK